MRPSAPAAPGPGSLDRVNRIPRKGADSHPMEISRRPPAALAGPAWSGPWLLYSAAAGALVSAHQADSSAIGTGLVLNLLGVSAVAAVLFTAVRSRRGARLPWILLALGLAAFVAGDVVANHHEALFGTARPFPSLADAFYLAVYPCVALGILRLVHLRRPGRDHEGLLDSLIVALGAGVLSWTILMSPHVRDASLAPVERLASIGYPLADLLLLAVVVRLVASAGRRHESAFVLLALSLVVMLVIDSAFAWTLAHGGTGTDRTLDLGWLVFYVLLATAALHPSAHKLSDPATQEPQTLGRWRLGLLGAATMIVPVTEAAHYGRGRPVDVPLLVLSAITLFGLAVLRMAAHVRSHEHIEARFSSLVRNSSDVVIVLAPDTTITYASAASERVLGYRPDELVGRKLWYIVHPNDRENLVAFVGRATANEGTRPVPMEFSILHGGRRWLHVESLSANLLGDPNVNGIVLNTRDITERKAFERQLEHLAFHDPITDLANSALFRDRVEHAVARQRRGSLPLAVLFLDLDDFKAVNDSYGHAAGDALLREVGRRLRTCIRGADTAARLGGDEFAVLLEGAQALTVVNVADRILQVLASPFTVDGNEVFVRASVGIAFADAGRRDPRGAAELLRNADVAMYAAKEKGKGRYEVFEPDMQTSVHQRLALKADLERALGADELTVLYQPVVRLETGEITGLEALVRWEHPERGTLLPADFVPVAEDTGLIVPIGSFVLERACSEVAELNARLRPDAPLTVSVNMSGRQLQPEAIVREVADVLAETDLEPRSLVLELSEEALTGDLDASVARLQQLRRVGVRLAVDDFGAGSCSLTSIRRLPIDIVKLDPSFVDGLGDDGEVSALTGVLVEVAGILDLHTVAESVERPEQLERLRLLGCHSGQGLLFSAPVALGEIEDLLAEGRVAA
jgi:diguanylate cyclase (GGDEF)-like protein/PAS domain S-box-containing protein